MPTNFADRKAETTRQLFKDVPMEGGAVDAKSAVIYTHVGPPERSIWVRAGNAGARLKIVQEEAHDETDGNFVVPQGQADVYDIADDLPHRLVLPKALSPCARLRITDNALNTAVPYTIELWMTEIYQPV